MAIIIMVDMKLFRKKNSVLIQKKDNPWIGYTILDS